MASPAPVSQKSTDPISDADFESLMRGVGRFETAPVLAVGVSGGADSMALALLADRWVRRRGGLVIALTVDHRLRPESAREARQARAWLRSHDIEHRTLRWEESPRVSGIEAAARTARFDLLAGWCRRHGALHLLVAHHLDDQAETILMRLARGSGPDGLAGMSASIERPHLRIIRPLLNVPSSRLRATLTSMGQGWVEDPSNRDPAFTRARLRTAMPSFAAEGLSAAALGEAARKLGAVRAGLEHSTARLLAECADIFPGGYCRLRAEPLVLAPREVAGRALSWIVTAVGGNAYTPRVERLDRLLNEIVAGDLNKPRTLGGCVISPRDGNLLVVREPKAVEGPKSISAGAELVWDRRFRVKSPARRPDGRPLTVGALGGADWTMVRRNEPAMGSVPRAAGVVLPAIRAGRSVVRVPHLGWTHESWAHMPELSVVFSPPNAVARAMFSVV